MTGGATTGYPPGAVGAITASCWADVLTIDEDRCMAAGTIDGTDPVGTTAEPGAIGAPFDVRTMESDRGTAVPMRTMELERGIAPPGRRTMELDRGIAPVAMRIMESERGNMAPTGTVTEVGCPCGA